MSATILKRIIAAVVLLSVCLPPNISAYALSTLENKAFNYVALGDSIAAYNGMEKGEGYAELLAEKLETEAGYGKINISNLAHSGDDSKDLLNMIKDEKNKNTIANADLITISIGGNNFLGVLFNALAESIGSSDILQQLEFPESILKFAALSLLAPEVQSKFAAGIARFSSDLPNIIKELKTLAPNAEIYFMTVYNPRVESDPLYAIVDGLVKQINGYIEKNASADTYTVVNIYTAYNQFDGNKPTLSAGGLDPHPNKNGHLLIADVHYTSITGTNSKNEPVYEEKNKDITSRLTDKPLTRAETVALLIDVLSIKMSTFFDISNLPFDDKFGFIDVLPAHPQYKQIMVAKTLGIVYGTGDSKFNPDKTMTRQDYACIINNFFNIFAKYGLLEPLTIGTAMYSDVNDVAAYAKDSMLKAANAKLMTTKNGKLNPLGTVCGLDLAEIIK